MGVPPNHSKLEHFSIETNGDWGSSIFRNPPNIGDVTPRLTFGSAFMRLCVLIILYIYMYWIFNGLLPTYNWEISSVLVSHFLCSAEAADASGTRFPRHGLHGFSYGTPTVKVEPYSTQMVVPELQKFKRIPSLVQLQNELRAGFVEGLELSFTVLLAAWHVLGIPFNNPGTADIHRFLFPDQHRQGRT